MTPFRVLHTCFASRANVYAKLRLRWGRQGAFHAGVHRFLQQRLELAAAATLALDHVNKVDGRVSAVEALWGLTAVVLDALLVVMLAIMLEGDGVPVAASAPAS